MARIFVLSPPEAFVRNLPAMPGDLPGRKRLAAQAHLEKAMEQLGASGDGDIAEEIEDLLVELAQRIEDKEGR